MVNYSPTSPYYTTPQYSWRIGRYVHRYIPPAADDQDILVAPRHEGRPDILSNDLYGTPAYWWVVANRNPAYRSDPVFGLKAGFYIVMPSFQHLTNVIGS